jgi:hypothetical protein
MQATTMTLTVTVEKKDVKYGGGVIFFLAKRTIYSLNFLSAWERSSIPVEIPCLLLCDLSRDVREKEEMIPSSIVGAQNCRSVAIGPGSVGQFPFTMLSSSFSAILFELLQSPLCE